MLARPCRQVDHVGEIQEVSKCVSLMSEASSGNVPTGHSPLCFSISQLFLPLQEKRETVERAHDQVCVISNRLLWSMLCNVCVCISLWDVSCVCVRTGAVLCQKIVQDKSTRSILRSFNQLFLKFANNYSFIYLYKWLSGENFPFFGTTGQLLELVLDNWCLPRKGFFRDL